MNIIVAMSLPSFFIRLILTVFSCLIFIKVMYGILGEYRGTRVYWKFLIPALIAIWFWR